MSLRLRLIASIVLVLLAALVFGGAVAGWHAVRSVRTEMRAALSVGAQTLRNGVDGIAAETTTGRDEELARLVHAFDGDRHVRALLRDGAGNALMASRLRPAPADLPGWFVAALSPSLAPLRLAANDAESIELEADPRNEIGEVWTQFQDDLGAAALSCTMCIGLVCLVIGRALKPLDRLSAALARLGDGEYAIRLPGEGPPELARLASGFNTMAEQLGEERARSARLDDQLLNLQEEERTDLARDLHDEVGPFLFAVSLDAAAIERAAASGDLAAMPGIADERARAIRESVEHMQRHVRSMLHLLRPASPVEVGLAAALGNLVAFWRSRRPDIAFTLDVSADEDALGDPALAAIYRLVQEGLSNAVRHGRPRGIDVSVRDGACGDVVACVVDDGAGLSTYHMPGLGLTGMRERMFALGGDLRVGAGTNGAGLAVTASVPRGDSQGATA